MKGKGKYIFIFFVFSAVIIYSCVKKPVYPSTPLIAYSNVLRYGANPADPDPIKVAITFEDEEGDIGISQSDTSGVFKHGNIWLVYWYDSTNPPNSYPYHWCPFDTTTAQQTHTLDSFKIALRVPVVLAQNTTQPMKGIIYARLDRGSIHIPTHKIIKYGIYLYDRAMHKSNYVYTDPLVFQ